MGKGWHRVGGGANPCSSWVHISTHQSFLHCTLNPAIHFNGSTGTAYNGASNSHKQLCMKKWTRQCCCLIRPSVCESQHDIFLFLLLDAEFRDKYGIQKRGKLSFYEEKDALMKKTILYNFYLRPFRICMSSM
jgi:hypothetical protein